MQRTASTTISRGKLRKHELLQVASRRNFKVDEEHYLDYRKKFMFLKANGLRFSEISTVKTELKYIIDYEQRCIGVRYLLKVNQIRCTALVQNQGGSTF